MIYQIDVIPNEIKDLQALFLYFFSQHELMHHRIQTDTMEALKYEPDIGLENAVELLKNLYNKQIAKLHYNELKKRLPHIKISQIELENIWYYLSPDYNYRNYAHYNKNPAKLFVFFASIDQNSRWRIYKKLCDGKSTLLIDVKNQNLLDE
jgi:hypothetical protein